MTEQAKKLLARGIVAIALGLITANVLAHKASDSYLTLDLTGDRPSIRWDIALRDLEFALGLDTDSDGAITWGELRARHSEIAGFSLTRLELSRLGERCVPDPPRQRVDKHSDGAYTVLEFALRCPNVGPLTLEYRLLFDLDPLHRGLLQVRTTQATRAYVLSPQASRIVVDTQSAPGQLRQFADYWRDGVWHIWIGFDHLLFLFALLIPAVVHRDTSGWRAVREFRPALRDMAAVITAFTIAHSTTLAVAVLGAVNLPSAPVEAAIAATVVLGALNNIYPVIHGRRWVIAFLLGLVHGFGFASVLSDLGLPDGTLAIALAAFNLGVECGQLAIAAVFVPIAYYWRNTWLYRRGVLVFGSLAIASIGTVWFAQRSLSVTLLSL